MSHYTEVLEEARNNATSSAKKYIPELYHILVDEEHKTAEDARGIIEHDLLEYWSKATVGKYLPQETKDEEKVKAGKQGAKATNLVLAGGQSVTVPPDGSGSVSPRGNDDEEEPTELELAKIEIQQLKDVIKKTEQFKPAAQLQESKAVDVYQDEHYFKWLADKANGVQFFYYDSYGIDLFKTRELSQLKNQGVKIFRRLYFEV